MDSFRQKEAIKLQLQEKLDSNFTREEIMRRRKNLCGEDLPVDVREVKLEDLTCGRYISCIKEVLSLSVITFDYTFKDFSRDVVHNVTCFGRVVSVRVRGNTYVLVLDDGTGRILVTYDHTYLLSSSYNIVEMVKNMDETLRWSHVEIETIKSNLGEATELSESIKPIELWQSILVFGYLSETKESKDKFIIATYITHIDCAAESALIKHIGSQYFMVDQ